MCGSFPLELHLACPTSGEVVHGATGGGQLAGRHLPVRGGPGLAGDGDVGRDGGFLQVPHVPPGDGLQPGRHEPGRPLAPRPAHRHHRLPGRQAEACACHRLVCAAQSPPAPVHGEWLSLPLPLSMVNGSVSPCPCPW